VSGTYRPTNIEPGEIGELDSFAAPAPGGPYGSALSVFNGTAPNGLWSLYVVDDGPGDQGSIAGWVMTITTASASQQSVTPVEHLLTIFRKAGGQVSINIQGVPNQAVELESSGDLQSWQTLPVIYLDETGFGAYHDSSGEIPTQFYRLRAE
jgi:hypothetical protein